MPPRLVKEMEGDLAKLKLAWDRSQIALSGFTG
jgi:hypothetical protein